jgi:hypothetical protein
VKVDEPGWSERFLALGLSGVEYGGPTVKRRTAKDPDLGWRPGAKKPGNAGGAKDFTVFSRERTNISYTQR